MNSSVAADVGKWRAPRDDAVQVVQPKKVKQLDQVGSLQEAFRGGTDKLEQFHNIEPATEMK